MTGTGLPTPFCHISGECLGEGVLIGAPDGQCRPADIDIHTAYRRDTAQVHKITGAASYKTVGRQLRRDFLHRTAVFDDLGLTVPAAQVVQQVVLAHLHIGDFRCIQQPRHGAVLDDNVRRRSLLTGALLQCLQRPRQIHMEGVPLYRLYNKAQRADTVPVQRELLQIRAKMRMTS